jgi:hypothetical protein
MRLIAPRLLINRIRGDLYSSFRLSVSFSSYAASLEASLLAINFALSELCAVDRCCCAVYSIALFALVAAYPWNDTLSLLVPYVALLYSMYMFVLL